MSEANLRRTPPWLELAQGEDLWLRASPSKNVLLAGVGVGFAVLIVGSVAVGAVGDVSTGRLLSAVMLALIVGLLASVYVIAERREYVLTSDRVIIRAASPWRSRRDVPLTQVEDITIEQSRWERWIRVGRVRLEIGSQGPDVLFSFVEDPHFVFERATESLTSTPDGRPVS